MAAVTPQQWRMELARRGVEEARSKGDTKAEARAAATLRAAYRNGSDEDRRLCGGMLDGLGIPR